MSRPKGGKNRKWAKEEKIRIVRRNIFDHVGLVSSHQLDLVILYKINFLNIVKI